MNTTKLLAVALVACLPATGCNLLIGAGEPEIVAAGPDQPSEETETGYCGDGLIQSWEQCDDANFALGDGCNECIVECDGKFETKDSQTNHCYSFAAPDRFVNWADAETECEAWGGTLAVVTSKEELALVQDSIRDDVWIGAMRSGSNATFEWVNGESWDFTSWSPNNPTSNGNCLSISIDSMAFANADCVSAHGFLCEREPVGTKVP